MILESRRKEARWGSIALGWLVAVLAEVLVGPLLRALFGLRAKPHVVRGEFTAAVIAFLISSCLVYLVGGYVAARLAGYPVGFNGAMTAVFVMVFGMMLAALGATHALGVALPPMIVGSGASATVVSLVPLLVNLLGGFVVGNSKNRLSRGEDARIRRKVEASPSACSTAR